MPAVQGPDASRANLSIKLRNPRAVIDRIKMNLISLLDQYVEDRPITEEWQMKIIGFKAFIQFER